jgi:hypothetical protein
VTEEQAKRLGQQFGCGHMTERDLFARLTQASGEMQMLREENERLKAVLAEIWGVCTLSCDPYSYEEFAPLLSEMIHKAEQHE